MSVFLHIIHACISNIRGHFVREIDNYIKKGKKNTLCGGEYARRDMS
jgi:hypothetical protein